MPSIELSASHALITLFTPQSRPMKSILLLCPFYRRGNWGQRGQLVSSSTTEPGTKSAGIKFRSGSWAQIVSPFLIININWLGLGFPRCTPRDKTSSVIYLGTAKMPARRQGVSSSYLLLGKQGNDWQMAQSTHPRAIPTKEPGTWADYISIPISHWLRAALGLVSLCHFWPDIAE